MDILAKVAEACTHAIQNPHHKEPIHPSVLDRVPLPPFMISPVESIAIMRDYVSKASLPKSTGIVTQDDVVMVCDAVIPSPIFYKLFAIDGAFNFTFAQASLDLMRAYFSKLRSFEETRAVRLYFAPTMIIAALWVYAYTHSNEFEKFCPGRLCAHEPPADVYLVTARETRVIATPQAFLFGIWTPLQFATCCARYITDDAHAIFPISQLLHTVVSDPALIVYLLELIAPLCANPEHPLARAIDVIKNMRWGALILDN